MNKLLKKKTIKKLFHKWTYCLGLRWWNVKLCLYDDPQDIIKHFQTVENIHVVAVSYCDWRYTSCTIDINFPAIRQMNKNDAEKVIIHELCHALVNEMREEGVEHEERVATILTNAFTWTEAFVKGKK